MMRTVRSAEEIERISFASKLTDQSIEALATELRAGMREDEIPAIIEPVYLKQGGYAGIHFMSSMPMRDPDFPVPAQFQSRRKLQKGDCLITEISGAPVNDAEDLVKGVREANKLQRRAVLLKIKSGNETRFVAVQLKRS